MMRLFPYLCLLAGSSMLTGCPEGATLEAPQEHIDGSGPCDPQPIFESSCASVICHGAVEEGSPGAVLRGQLEHQYRACQINTFGGGVNEIQREIVAMLGLGMPRAPR